MNKEDFTNLWRSELETSIKEMGNKFKNIMNYQTATFTKKMSTDVEELTDRSVGIWVASQFGDLFDSSKAGILKLTGFKDLHLEDQLPTAANSVMLDNIRTLINDEGIPVKFIMRKEVDEESFSALSE